MLSDEEKKELQELINLLYNGHISQYGKRKLEVYIKKQQKEIEELSDKLTEKICKGVEEEILEEYRQTIISKDKEIEELKEKYSKKLIEFQKEREWYEKNYISKDKIKEILDDTQMPCRCRSALYLTFNLDE